MKTADSIQIPERPGTTWKPRTLATPFLTCEHCGKGYNSHGAPVDVADAFKITHDKRHLICPASDDAWEQYRRLRQRATINDFVNSVVDDAEQIGASPEELATIARRLLDIYVSKVTRMTPEEEAEFDGKFRQVRERRV